MKFVNLELDKVAKEINKNLQEREAIAEETRREEQVLKHKEEIKGIVYDIKRVDKAIEKEEEEETDPIQEREEEIGPDLDQDKGTLIKVKFVVSATEVDTLLTTALDWKDI